ncbi:hypothetical protein ABZ957_10720 [Streptomyces sp. NPDC046316]|uniref:hypothetical protein n=1 Tax=Streptomyces sp. NPDC046316 TaxID=3154494 RepID=UPI0033DA7539
MKRVSKAVGLYLLVVTAVLGYGWILWKGPWVFDGSHLRQRDLQPADGVVITGFRTMAVAVGAGFIAAAGLLYTHRNHKLAQEQFRHTQEQFTLAQRQFDLAQEQFKQSQKQFSHERDKDRKAAQSERQARATEQYVTAIRLLASDNPTERTGGIYSLQEIARTSEENRAAIREMLTTFLRHREEEMADQTGGAREFSKNRTVFGNDYEVARDALAHLGS